MSNLSLTTFVISHSIGRSNRVGDVLHSLQMEWPITVPAKFNVSTYMCKDKRNKFTMHTAVNGTINALNNSCTACHGTNGHQVAYRDALSRAKTHERSCIFEDDVVVRHGNDNDLSNYIMEELSHSDILYLSSSNYCRGFFCNHAICFTQAGVLSTMAVTHVCLKHKTSIDVHMNKACHKRRLNCKSGRAVFAQDRINIKSFLHNRNNKYIGP